MFAMLICNTRLKPKHKPKSRLKPKPKSNLSLNQRAPSRLIFWEKISTNEYKNFKIRTSTKEQDNTI